MKIKRIFLVILALISLCSCTVKNNIDETTTVAETTTVSNTVKVTFPEGFTVTQIAQRLEENGVCSFDDFIAESNNRDYLTEFGIDIPNPDDRSFLLEGYLFPDTYEFYKNENPQSVIKRFLRNTNEKITPEMKEQATALGYTMDEILTIASIVQEETFYESELKNVSSVIHNRLSSPDYPKVECDCTIFYLERTVKDFVTAERYDELRLLYNTYKCNGLPAGPITNSSILAVKAALEPSETSYYYFVTDSDNNYYFASNWQEHQKNCKICGY